MNCLYLLILLVLSCNLRAESYDFLDYKSGFSTIQALGRDLHRSLESNERLLLSPQPISLDTSRKPFARLLYYTDGAESIRGVWVSQGFIDLVNHVAHAQAINKKRKGYFARYIQSLETASDSIPPLPERENPEFWTDSMLNEQLSNFNSIVGIVVGIKLSQHYLGLYGKYENRLKGSDGEPLPLNNLLTQEEWEQSYRRGLANAMNASCMTEGFLPFCEAISQMKTPPSWVGDFFPQGIRFDVMRKDMVKLQRKFLNN